MVKWPINTRLYKPGRAAARDDSLSVYGCWQEVRVICSFFFLFALIIICVDEGDAVNIFDWPQTRFNEVFPCGLTIYAFLMSNLLGLNAYFFLYFSSVEVWTLCLTWGLKDPFKVSTRQRFSRLSAILFWKWKVSWNGGLPCRCLQASSLKHTLTLWVCVCGFPDNTIGYW